MKARIAFIGAVVLLATASLAAAGFAGSESGPRGTVAVAKSKLGRILVDGRGRSLYLFARDRSRRSMCFTACATYWPPLIASGRPVPGAGARASLLGRTKRSDGRWQVTYNGHPLYTYRGDSAQGQTNGEEVDAYGGEWYLVSPAGSKVERDEHETGDAPVPGGYPYGP